MSGAGKWLVALGGERGSRFGFGSSSRFALGGCRFALVVGRAKGVEASLGAWSEFVGVEASLGAWSEFVGVDRVFGSARFFRRLWPHTSIVARLFFWRDAGHVLE